MYNNKRLILSIFWIVLGTVLMVLSVMEKIDPSMCSAMGGALIAIGALQTIRNLRYRRVMTIKVPHELTAKNMLKTYRLI